MDARSDVYSLGVVLYHALAGRFPYSVVGPVREVLDNIATAVPPPPSQSPARWHASWGPTSMPSCSRPWPNPPDQRYASAGALARDLEAYLAGKPVIIRYATPATRTVRRRWWVLPTVLLVLMGGNRRCCLVVASETGLPHGLRPAASHQPVRHDPSAASLAART